MQGIFQVYVCVMAGLPSELHSLLVRASNYHCLHNDTVYVLRGLRLIWSIRQHAH